MAKARVSSLPPASVVGGRFIVEDALGRGGMAAVYRVREAKSGKRFALKRLWAKRSQRALRHRALLEREFHTLAHLRHPRIIEVYDYGVDADGPYYTMELLEGVDLDQGGRVSWTEACALLRDIASSLAIVHSRGLIHRDVSGRNVCRTADGRAKLIDFGGMVSMGVANDVVGTPPFMAPEVLQMQALDARADLFSLGALGYYLLTGRHAFAVRRANELRDAWRSRPASPSRVQPEVPAALSALILQLLSLDRGARPQTAAEVMERLCVIAELPKEELPEIQRGYLATPTLVGRHKALLAIRNGMLALVRGDGGALLLEGRAGSGRSRMIDACVFEGKLLSVQVARADAGDAGEAWGVARAIASQLFAALPQEAAEASRLSAGVLSHVIEELRQEHGNTATASSPERSLLLRELRDFVLALTRSQRLLLVVDDADRIDEPSAAWLAALADKADRCSLLVVAAIEQEDDQPATGSLSLFRSLAQSVALPALDGEQTEALLRSVFGDVAHVGLVAGNVHALAQGHPRATMELAQHLVERGLARYEAGSWLLPEQLDPTDLPKTLADGLARRLAKLSADARELAEALCVADTPVFPPSAYRVLTRHRDQARWFGALEELVSARLLLVAADSYRFSQRGIAAVVLAAMSAERKAALHASLAQLLADSGGDVIQRAQHLLAAGREAEAVRLLCSIDLQTRQPPLALLEAAVAFAERSASLPARALHRLRMSLMGKAALRLEVESFRRCLPHLRQQLEQDSGLAAYQELHAEPLATRLSQALTLQQQRYLNLPESEQVHPVGDAIRELARLTGAACAVAGSSFDLASLDELPSIEPFLPLSPALRVVTQNERAVRHWLAGQTYRAINLYEQTLARIAEPDRAGMDEVQYERTLTAVNYTLALFEATNGIDRAEERAKLLESRRPLRVNAWRVRALLHSAQGDNDAARKAVRRSELLQLQDDGEQHFPGTGVGFQMTAYFMASDLLRVKRADDALQALATNLAGWRPHAAYGRSCYLYLSGDLEGALAVVLAGFEISQPGKQLAWGLLASQHIKLLRELGRTAEALERAQQYVALVERLELTMAERFVRMECAQTLAAAGQHHAARALIEALIAQVEGRGSRGLALGVFYEAQARIALAARDRDGFERAAALCANEYGRGHNPALSAKFGRLMEEARQLEMAHAEGEVLERALFFELEAPEREDQNGGLLSRMSECVDGADRARCALTVLLQSANSYLGHLYGVLGERLVALASLPVSDTEPALEHWLAGFLHDERQHAAERSSGTTVTERRDSTVTQSQPLGSTQTDGGRGSSGAAADYVDPEGRRFHALLLISDDAAQPKIAAVLALQVGDSPYYVPPQTLLTRVANELLSQGDVTGVLYGEPA